MLRSIDSLGKKTKQAAFICCAVLACGGAAMAGSGLLNADSMSAKAKNMGRYCKPYWNSSWLGPKSAVRSYPTVRALGTDLAKYKDNTGPMVALLHQYNVTAARTGNVSQLKSVMLDMAAKGHFTKLTPFKPQTWYGKKLSWLASYNGYAEPAYSAAVFLSAAAQSYALIEPQLSSDEKKLLKSWGSRIYRASQNARDDSKKNALDRRAGKAAGFTSWGAATGDQKIYRAGVAHFKSVVGHIRRDGRDDFFTEKDFMDGRELKYLSFTYGHLSVAAAIMESRGEAGFSYRKSGGTLADGLNYVISRSFDPSLRKHIAKKQEDVRFASNPRHLTVSSWAYMEFAARSVYVRQNVPGWKRALLVRGNGGFYGGNHGGYTSCLFGN
nr:alginate lyase family protein [uncultured Roseovarius sp.]